MADSLFNACGDAGKCLRTFFTRLEHDSSGTLAEVPMRHEAVISCLQFHLMRMVSDIESSFDIRLAALSRHRVRAAALPTMVKSGEMAPDASTRTRHARVRLQGKVQNVSGTDQTPLSVLLPSAEADVPGGHGAGSCPACGLLPNGALDPQFGTQLANGTVAAGIAVTAPPLPLPPRGTRS